MNPSVPELERKSSRNINTVVDYVGSDGEDGESDEVSNVSQAVPVIGGACVRGPENPGSPSRHTSKKRIAIELKVSPTGEGRKNIEANPSVPRDDFLAGPVSLLSRGDLMHMIQEGVRIGISERADDNRLQVVKNTHSGESIEPNGASSSSESPEGQRRTMKYILSQYKPKNFEMLRRMSGISNADFVKSICDADLVGGYTENSGKSGSLFWYSADGKYIMKSINPQERALLEHKCSAYLRYMGSHPHSLLCRFYGMFKIVTTVATPSYIRGAQRASRIRANTVITTRFVIMNNVFCVPESLPMEKFDLKGTTEDRFVKPVSGKEVMKDINFQNRWISLPDPLADCLNKVVREDSDFLNRHGIMDYSLIVGVLKPEPNSEILEHLGRETVGEDVQTYFAVKPKTIQEKLNEQITAAKSAVQRLLSPANTRGQAASQNQSAYSSNLQSIHEAAVEDEPQVNAPIESIAPRVGPVPQRSTSTRPLPPSVFRTFNGGVVGLDENGTATVVYYLGIIDILQQYTMKKKAAHLIKRCTIGCCHEIDTVAPNRYKARFARYMAGKIRAVPDERVEAVLTPHGLALPVETDKSDGLVQPSSN